jgi:EAL and modified HD-GYP domain-containing signal transduction protein
MKKMATLIPVVNNQQRLYGLISCLETSSDEESIIFLKKLSDNAFFEKLSNIIYYLEINDPLNIPINLADRVPNQMVVLNICEQQCESKEAQKRLKYFLEQGFQIKMDEFSSKSSAIWQDTKGMAFNCQQGIPAHAKEWLIKLHNNQHLAKKIGNYQLFQEAIESGFSLFYGDFPFELEDHKSSEDPTARTRLLKLLGLVSRDADSVEIEELFKQDVSLSYMLFKIVSTAAFSQTVKVTSFKQAINLLGRRQLQRWLQLLLYSRAAGLSAALNPLMLRAAFRAGMMEAICKQNGGDSDAQDCAFMAGMFSLLDILFASPLEEILLPLTLSTEVVDALLDRTGLLGQQLHLVCLADRENVGNLNDALLNVNMSEDQYYQALIQAYIWVNQLSQDM